MRSLYARIRRHITASRRDSAAATQISHARAELAEGVQLRRQISLIESMACAYDTIAQGSDRDDAQVYAQSALALRLLADAHRALLFDVARQLTASNLEPACGWNLNHIAQAATSNARADAVHGYHQAVAGWVGPEAAEPILHTLPADQR